MDVDVIVNAANSQLEKGGGVCGAIFKAAQSSELTKVCQKLAPVATGEAVITPGYSLKARAIIHAVGPIYDPSDRSESERLLRLAYRNSLNLAVDSANTSIAFPLISSGIYGYPRSEAFRIANEEIQNFLKDQEMTVYLTLFDKQSFMIGQKLHDDIQAYINDNYVSEHLVLRNMAASYKSTQLLEDDENLEVASYVMDQNLDDRINTLDEPFSATLFRFIDERELSDVEVYKGANIDRKLFSKIRTNPNYIPRKNTILAFAISLHLSLDETNLLLKTAGYALSKSRVFDVIVEYFIFSNRYDIYEINEVLFAYDQSLLGS